MRDKTYFLSDLHLGAPYIDDPRQAELRIVSFLDSIKNEAKEICFLGDVLDYWYEYKYVVPKGFVRFFGKLAELSDKGIKILWMIGNHDIWMFDYLPKEIGVMIVDGPITYECNGQKLLLAHGDGLGKTPATFKFLRKLFRNKFCQWLYAGIHPRWTIPFALNWSNSSRKSHSTSNPTSIEQTEMLHNLKEYAERVSINHPDIDVFLFGHLHEVEDCQLSSGKRMIVLGDWIDKFTYAVSSPNNPIEMKKFIYK